MQAPPRCGPAAWSSSGRGIISPLPRSLIRPWPSRRPSAASSTAALVPGRADSNLARGSPLLCGASNDGMHASKRSISALAITRPERVTTTGSVCSNATMRGIASAQSCDSARSVVPAAPAYSSSAAIFPIAGCVCSASSRCRIRASLRRRRRVPACRILPPTTVCGGDARRSTTCSPAGSATASAQCNCA